MCICFFLKFAHPSKELVRWNFSLQEFFYYKSIRFCNLSLRISNYGSDHVHMIQFTRIYVWHFKFRILGRLACTKTHLKEREIVQYQIASRNNKCLEIMHKINKRRIASICIKNVMCASLGIFHELSWGEASHELKIR